MNSTVVGLDLSLTSTGVATIHPDGTTTVDTIQTKGKAGASLAQRCDRLTALTDWIVAAAYRADLVVIEQPAFSRTTGHMHDRSGLWWLVVSDLRTSTTVIEVPPSSRAKYATGKGNAAKDAVLASVVRRYPDVPVSNNDEADALILAAMGRRHLGQPIDDLPLTHVTAMSKVAWPEPAEAPY